LQNDRAAQFLFQYSDMFGLMACRPAEYPEIKGQAELLIWLASASQNLSKPNKSAILEWELSCSIIFQ